jgi:catechol 2,3-dioxygenase-like lactoylglutathione lyase family enzyme
VTKHHHVGLRVSDMARATAFYEEALGAQVIVGPFTIDGEFASMVLGEPPDVPVKWRNTFLSCEGGALELFEFESPKNPIAPTAMAAGNVLHFAVQVDDVAATLARVEAAGGHRLWPEVVDLEPGVQVIYVADPDHNVIELMNFDPVQLIGIVDRAFPSD